MDVWLRPGYKSPVPLPSFGTSLKVHSRPRASGGDSCSFPRNQITVSRFHLFNLSFFNSFPTTPNMLLSRPLLKKLYLQLSESQSLFPRELDLCTHSGLGLLSPPCPSWFSLRIQGPCCLTGALFTVPSLPEDVALLLGLPHVTSFLDTFPPSVLFKSSGPQPLLPGHPDTTGVQVLQDEQERRGGIDLLMESTEGRDSVKSL